MTSGIYSWKQGWFNRRKSMNITNCISRIKVGEHMIISANEEKIFDKIQHFHEKNMEQINRRKVSKHNKGHI